MGDKAILENDRTLKFVPDCYKTQKMCFKAADNYLHAWEFIRRCYITQKMCDKAVVSYPSAIQIVPECYKTQEMWNKSVNVCFIYKICIWNI